MNQYIDDIPSTTASRAFYGISFSPEKRGEETRSSLKSKGFRWTPSLGAWQAYINTWSKEFAEKIVAA